MSSAAAWANTSKATHWSLLSRSDWDGARTWAAPVVFSCDYSAESAKAVDDTGVEFVTRQTIYTERAGIKRGDMVLIGESTNADPVAAGAIEVRAVTRYADTFGGKAEDVKVLC